MAKLGFAIVGLGSQAELHARVIESLDMCSLVAVCSRKLARAKEFSSRHGACSFYDEVEYLLEDVNVDVVVVTTPTGLHLNPSKLSLKAGKHIIIESPLEINQERAKELIDLSEDEGVYLATPYLDRFKESTEILKQAIKSGRLGKVESINLELINPQTISFFKASPWRHNPELAGGNILFSALSEEVDRIFYLIDEKVVDAVLITSNTNDELEFDDSANLELGFSSGVKAHIFATLDLEKRPDFCLSIKGMKGCATMEKGRVQLINNISGEKEEIDYSEEPIITLLTRFYLDFLDALTKGKELSFSTMDAFRVISVSQSL